MNLTSIEHPKTGQGSTHVLVALQSSSLRAGSGWGKCPDESQGCRTGAFALLLPGDSCWVCPSMIMTPTSKYSNIDFTFVCPH